MSQILVTGEAKVRDIQGPVVANSGVITALDGDASQYVRGDGTLADFPTSTGGGSSVSYYLNSSVSQGTIGGVAYRQLSKTPVIGAGTDITISANGYVANYITDANDPALLEVPGGNFNCEFYFSVNSNNHNPFVYAELYKYDGTNFTLLGSNQAIPDYLSNGTTLSAYYFAIPVAVAALTITDRLAIRIYVNVDGRVVTLHTENNHLCQVVTTFSKGLTSLNNLTRQVQFLATGSSGTDFNISSSVATHTFNLPIASATNTGKLSSTDWSTFNSKQPAGNYVTLDTTQTISGEKTFTGDTTAIASSYFNLDGIGGAAGSFLNIKQYTTTVVRGVGYSSIGAYDKTQFIFYLGNTTAFNSRIFKLDGTNITVNTPRTYLMPDADGTLALLEGTQTFSGANTFTQNPIINGTSTNSAYTILQSAGTNKWRIGNNYAAGVNTFDIFAYDNSTTPLSINSNGAMTLSANVTTTGAQFVQNGFYLTNANGGALAGYTLMHGSDNGINFALRNLTGGASFIFQSASSYSYTFPATTGTLALTSNLSAYLPLTGGTLTGALSGTSATFSGSVAIGTNPASSAAGAVLRLPYDNAIRWRNSSNTADIGFYLGTSNLFQFDSGINVGGGATATDLQINGGTTSNIITNITSNSTFAFGSTNGRRVAQIRYNTGDAPGLQFGYDATDNTGIIAGATQATGAGLDFYTFNGSTWGNRMRITSGGNVLIGKTTTGVDTAGFRFDSSGVLFTSVASGENTYYLRDITNTVYRFYVTSGGTINATNTTISAISDIRLKENISDLEIGLDAIMALRPRKFDWKKESGNSGKNVRGFIAQEFEEIFPDLIDESINPAPEGEEPYKQIRQDLIPILVKAMQQQQAQIEELKAMILAK
jgi:hypothetical protein